MELIFREASVDKALSNLLKDACRQAAIFEGISYPCFAQLLLTDDKGINVINLVQRNIDASTDVLSFPSISYPVGYSAGKAENLLSEEWDSEQRAYFLGDIVISTDHATLQALDCHHSFQREICYLLVHGLMHLFGYDHQKKADKINMRKQEEQILQSIGQNRDEDQKLLDLAREAMKSAYAPYSNYQVGACILAEDGRMFTGCNVENASFGLTNCGERTAIFKAVSEGERKFKTIAIAADSMPPWPCGACRQVLSEFCPDIRVLVTWDKDQVKETTLKELLPYSFSPSNGVQDHLGKDQT